MNITKRNFPAVMAALSTVPLVALSPEVSPGYETVIEDFGGLGIQVTETIVRRWDLVDSPWMVYHLTSIRGANGVEDWDLPQIYPANSFTFCDLEKARTNAVLAFSRMIKRQAA